MKEREKLKSRLGFILISAGCAIGIEMYGSFPIWRDREAAEPLFYSIFCFW